MTDKTQPSALPRYKIGYYSDEQGMRSSTPTGIPDPQGQWVRFEHAQTLIAHAQRRHEAELAAIGAGGVSGPLFGGPEQAPQPGYVLVPVEPTADQEWAGKQAALRGSTMAEACKIYKAMIAASPKAPQQDVPAQPDDFGSAEHWKEKAQYWAGVAHRLRGEALRGEPVDGIIQPPTTSPHAAQAPKPGYVLVPDASNMTDEQAEAIAKTANCCGGIAYDIYRAALAASPKAPQQAAPQQAAPAGGLWTVLNATGWPVSENITPDAAKAMLTDERVELGWAAIPATTPQAAQTPQQEVQEPVVAAVFDEQLGRPVLVEGAPMLKHGQLLYTAQPAPSGDAEDDIEAAAKTLAQCMDYPWEHMPDKGRAEMRKHAQAVINAARKEGK